MNELLIFGMLAFTSFFSIVNPIGIIPVFTGLTSEMTPEETVKTARTATVVAFFITILFAFMGELIFKLFGISVNSFKVVGGIIFFMMGYDMLQARLTRTKMNKETMEEFSKDIAITPLGIPMLCGPGAIANSLVLMETAKSVAEKIILISVISLIYFVAFIALISGKKIMNFLGSSGNKVVLRLMGLIVMVIAVEFLFSGLKPILQDIFLVK
jgi:multiple antibiotic resistance protein